MRVCREVSLLLLAKGKKKGISWFATLPRDTKFTYGLKLLIRANLHDHYSFKKDLIFRIF